MSATVSNVTLYYKDRLLGGLGPSTTHIVGIEMRERDAAEEHADNPREPRQLTGQVGYIPRQEDEPHFGHSLVLHQKPRVLEDERQYDGEHEAYQYRHQDNHQEGGQDYEGGVPIEDELVRRAAGYYEALDGLEQDDRYGVFEQTLPEYYRKDLGLVLGLDLRQRGDVVDAAQARRK